MARVVLISPPFQKDYMRNARCDFVSLSSSSWYPIWLGQAGAWLQGQGHETALMDAQLDGDSFDSALDRVAAFKPDLVAVYTGRLSEDNDIGFGDALAKKGLAVCFVGPYTSIDPDAVLIKATTAQYAIRKEFDLPLGELANGDAPEGIPNVHVRHSDGTVTHNDPRPLIKTEILDQFPIVSQYFNENLDIRKYKTPSELYPFMDVMSGRGCAWGKCNFCLWVQTFVDGSVYNTRSIDHFMQEFEYIRDYVPEIKSVMIQDDMLTNRRAIEISEALLDREIKIQWSCYMKPNSKIDQSTLDLMKRSGCLNLHIGFESGDDKVLENIDKGSTAEQAYQFSQQVHKAGLQIHGDFAMGHYGDDEASMQNTLDLAKRINPHTAQFQIMIPFKGTRFYDQLEANGALTAAGEPTYEDVGGCSSEEVRSFAKHAYRKFYFSPGYLKKLVTNPKDYFFNRMDEYVAAIPAVTWKRWVK